jgi:hypothetical protein
LVITNNKKKIRVDTMRSYVFTELERRRLREWLETGEEDQGTRELFMLMRRNAPQLIKDMKLLILMSKKLRGLNRWESRKRAPSGFRLRTVDA